MPHAAIFVALYGRWLADCMTLYVLYSACVRTLGVLGGVGAWWVGRHVTLGCALSWLVRRH